MPADNNAVNGYKKQGVLAIFRRFLDTITCVYYNFKLLL
ncbi:hypothetical protein M917_2413 [Psychrobacter aquaticus CMS 56]|uniref:Uncharacterized protein n=1 Tax=Psychrobacter aquaticus CMS 56 TaxID=1354303 RepID=U4T2B6_9GAMM|nr:hypothetical protein M917_2413 [Psychrobacter aquaticus CMS 56]